MFARPLYTAAFAQPKHAAPLLRRSIASSSRTAGFSSKAQLARSQPSSVLLLVAGGSALLASSTLSPSLRCEATTSAARPYAEPHHPAYQGPGSSRLARANEPPAVESSLDVRSLSFGAVAGISTGIFIRKGLRAAGFLLGGAFVFLQYLASRGMVNVDWRKMAGRYESAIDSYAGTGSGNRLQRVGSRVLDFLLADFPARSVFVAGLALGLRVG